MAARASSRKGHVVSHKGDLDRPYAEVLQVRFTPDGRAATAYVADVKEGTARPMFAIQDEVTSIGVEVDQPLG